MKSVNADIAVVIGRFQPFHRGHAHVIRTALDNSEHVLVLIGSANRARSPKNPWTFEERKEMLQKVFSQNYLLEDDARRITILPLDDNLYNENRWRLQVQRAVDDTACLHGMKHPKVIIAGHNKDSSSYYLNQFSPWQFLDVHEWTPSVPVIDATRIREMYFEGNLHYLSSVLPEQILTEMMGFQQSHKYHQLKDEYNFIKKYREQWVNTPYPVNFVTTDAVVVQSGHVLLVQRKEMPGKGQLALPGGFVKPDETVFDSCIRELVEETNLHVPEAILERANKGHVGDDYRVFDNPNRSQRGRIITHAFYFPLDDSKELPRVKAADDAATAVWLTFAGLEKFATSIFEDHADIIDFFINRSGR